MARPQRTTRTVKIIVVVVGVIAIAAVWAVLRPKAVAVMRPDPQSLTETIASSARVVGVRESAVGTQFSGRVERLYVRENDRVKPGQPIAMLKNDVPGRQKEQARAAVQTARARLAQVSKVPQRSELDQARHQVDEAKAQVTQTAAELRLAEQDYRRGSQMYREGLVARNEFDKVQANQQSLRSRMTSAKATVKVREAQLETLENTPLKVDVEVARSQLTEAEQALRVAEQQLKEATVTAPFAGVITHVNTEEGQTIGSQGVVSLVSDELEIRVDLDENNLADLEEGQKAVLSSAAFGDRTFEGRLKEIGAAVDQARGIVTVKIEPVNPPAWLRPGQTVNVNLVTNEKVERLIVPSSAVVRQGSRSVVMVVEDGEVREKQVVTRPTVSQGIPIASGLSEIDDVIVQPGQVKTGQAVRVKG